MPCPAPHACPVLPYRRDVSRQEYLKKREEAKLDELKEALEDEKYLFQVGLALGWMGGWVADGGALVLLVLASSAPGAAHSAGTPASTALSAAHQPPALLRTVPPCRA